MCRGMHLQAQAAAEQTPPSPTPSSHAYPRDWRRRSADVGGLHLALAAGGAATDFNSDPAADRESWDQDQTTLGAQGQGWMGGDPGAVETMFAELLSDMHTQTVISVNDNSLESPPTTISHSRRTRLIHVVDKWYFEPHLLDEDDVLACTLILFEALFRVEGMQEAIPISMHQITTFIHHLRKIYRYENTYHNFEHALDVLQATQSYLKSAGVVPPVSFLLTPEGRRWNPKKKFNSGSLIATLGLKELFVLYVAAIGHDAGHPGFNNHFMKNAQAPLALIYPLSALEQMHCQLLFLVMRAHGLGFVLDDRHLRKVLQQSVLATDMSVHDDFMETLRNVVEGGKGALCQRQVVMCQAILKNADISNPTRPFLVSKHWASALMQEWFGQAHLESTYRLTQTVKPSSDPIDEASSQIFFITRFARPLLELTEKAVPEMSMYVGTCKGNLKEWTRKRKGLMGEREREVKEEERRRAGGTGREGSKSVSAASSVPSTPATRAMVPVSLQAAVAAATAKPGSPRILGYRTAFPLTLPTHQPPSSSSSSTSSAENTPSLTQTQSRTHSHHNSSSSTSANGRDREQDDAASVPDSPSPSASDDAESVFSPVSETSGSGSGSGSSSQSRVHLNLSLHRYPSISSNASSTMQPTISNFNFYSNGGGGAGTGTGNLTATATPHAAIRAASKVGSMRKKSQTNLHFGFGLGGGGAGCSDNGVVAGTGGGGRKGVRNSWCANSSLGAGLTALFQAQMNANANGSSNSTTNGTSNGPNPPPASAPPNGVKPASASSSPLMSATATAAFMRPIKLQVSP